MAHSTSSRAFQQKIYRCFRCCTALRWNVGLIGQRACTFSSSSSRIWMCSCTFLYKQAEVGCLFFYLLLSCLIFLYMLLNSLFSGCFLTFLLFYFFPSFSYTCIFLSWFSMVYSSDLHITREEWFKSLRTAISLFSCSDLQFSNWGSEVIMSLFTAFFIPESSIGIYQPFPTLFQLCIKLLSTINTLLM